MALPLPPINEGALGHRTHHGEIHELLVGQPWYNVKAYGAVGDNVTNDQPAFQAALDAIKLAGRGNLLIPPADYKLTSGLSFDPSGARLYVFAYDATINFTIASGYAFSMQASSPSSANVGAKVYGGKWAGDLNASGCFFVSDVNRTEFHDCWVRDFTAGDAWAIWNQNYWTENTVISNSQSSNNSKAVNFTPASISLGTGTESFARTKIYGLTIAGTGAGPMINCRGSVYGSEIFNIQGNVSESPKIFHCEGGMSGTIIMHTDLEQSAYTLFEWGTFTGTPLTLIGPFVLRSSAVFETGTRPDCHGYNLPVTGQSGYYNGFPGGGITLRASNGNKYQITVSNTGSLITTLV